MRYKYFLFLILINLLAINSAIANSDLLYFELQGVVGYSFAPISETIYRSNNEYDVMQLNSLGIDYIKKISYENRDFITIKTQGRIAYNEVHDKIQFQIYNLFITFKVDDGNLWIGHNRIAFGLSSYLDTHADLLQLLPDYGFGYSRDWGTGYYIDLDNGDLKLSLTSGSGMPLVFDKKIIFDSNVNDVGVDFDGEYNLLSSIRASLGVLERDNYNVGASFMYGDVVDSMGYHFMNYKTSRIKMAAIDLSVNVDNREHRVEIDYGKMMMHMSKEREIFAGLYKFSIGFLDENRLKLEEQVVYKKSYMDDDGRLFLGTGASYKITSDITFRTMYEYNKDEQRIACQVYVYKLF
ncbi:MAG: hypothetical protein LBC92_04290 [Rickettsiales bacterium]|jgi:hypothetical protein|nr:hypothetical protein [Rickettsiales bacterium]